MHFSYQIGQYALQMTSALQTPSGPLKYVNATIMPFKAVPYSYALLGDAGDLNGNQKYPTSFH